MRRNRSRVWTDEQTKIAQRVMGARFLAMSRQYKGAAAARPDDLDDLAAIAWAAILVAPATSAELQTFVQSVADLRRASGVTACATLQGEYSAQRARRAVDEAHSRAWKALDALTAKR